jgi:hypothetical protein
MRGHPELWPDAMHPVDLLVERQTSRRFVKSIPRHERCWDERKRQTM